jgi:bifunctional non-homologous end joining protein LigD
MASRESGEQLSLHIADGEPAGALPHRLQPMQPLQGDAPFDDPEWFFEPWWPGTPALAYIEAGALQLHTEHLADPLESFRELESIVPQFPAGNLIVAGTLLVLDNEGRPDGELLRRRLASPRSRSGSPAMVCSDLLYARGRSLLTLPFEERRGRLARQLSDGDRCVVSRGLRGEGLTLAQAVSSMGLHEISARLLSARYRPGQQDGSWLRLPVIEIPVIPTRPLLALLQRLPL